MGKTSVVGTLVASICILVYLGALVSVIVRVSASMDQRRSEAAREFNALADVASAAGAVSFMDDMFADIIQTALNQSRVLEGVIISSPGEALGFEREAGHAITMVNDSPRFRSRFDFSRQNMFTHLRIPGMWNVNMEAVAGVFDRYALAAVLWDAMLPIAGALALAFFTLLIESSVKQRKRAQDSAYAEGDAEERVEEEAPRAAGKARATEAAPMAASEAAESARPEKPKPVTAHRPGNYSERGHVVRREHTEGRLTEEIARSAEAGQDIAFVAVEFKPHEADNYYARLASDAARFFSSREFVCERGERGLSIICPGLGLDMGFLNASEFHNRIINKYPGVFKQKTDLCMGVSARSGRDPINAARLVFEAEEALERALMDPASHVIAFKVDPEKYRAFMEGRRSASEA